VEWSSAHDNGASCRALEGPDLGAVFGVPPGGQDFFGPVVPGRAATVGAKNL
jgi:hypothetical protein